MLRSNVPRSNVPPTAPLWEHLHGRAGCGESGQDEGPLHGVVAGEGWVGHKDSAHARCGPRSVITAVRSTDRVRDRPGHYDFSLGRAWIVNLVTQHRTRQPRGVRVQRLKGRECFQPNVDRAFAVLELDSGDGEGPEELRLG